MIEIRAPFRDDGRAASEVVGAVLLIGLVGTAALITIVIGGVAIDNVQSQTDQRQASTILQELDSRFSSVSSSADAPKMEFDLGDAHPRDIDLHHDGFVNITVNEDAACAASIEMSSLQYENNNGGTVGYEGGGVWKRSPDGGSTMVTSPSLAYRSGTIDVHVVNVTGHVDQSNNEAVYDVATSREASLKASNRVFTGDCRRPNNVTVSVKSPYYQAWGDYMETEFGVSATTFDGNDTARVFLPQSALPERVDDTKNSVINLTDPPAGTVSIAPDSIEVDKGAGNVYSVSVTPLNQSGLNIGNVTNVEDATNVTRQPIDVMFVFDESGSMGNTDGDATSRLEESQQAAKRFVGGLNDSMDRAGVVGFNTTGRYRVTNGGSGHYLSGDFAAVNASIDDTIANGGTQAQHGIEYANNVFELRSNETRNRVMVLLSDGENNDCQDWEDDINNDDPFDCGGPNSDNRQTVARAEDAAANGVTVYTVGYGASNNIDEALLEEVADRTGGSFHHATDSDELDAVFEEIVEEISQTRAIALTPVSSNFTDAGAGRPYAPQAAGSMDHIASVNIDGEEFANINDPTASSRFSHSFAISDGDTVEIEAYDFECEEWRGTGRTRTHGGDQFQVVRCSEIVKDGTLPPDDVFLDGDQLVNTDGDSMVHEDEAWWQGPPGESAINASLNSNDKISVDRSTRPAVLELESNQALVYWDLEDGTDSENRLLMLYEIGLSEEDAETSGVINIEVSNVRVD